MNERLKKLRSALKLSQREFSSKINVGASTLAMFETGQRELKDIHISAICREFNVNEKWLRTGEGEMFLKLPPASELGTYIGQVIQSDDDFIKKIIVNYMQLDDKSKKIVRDFIQSLGPKE